MLMKNKLFNEIASVLMTVLIILPAFVVIQKMLLPDAAPWSAVLFLLPALLGYPLGRVLRTIKIKEMQTLQTLIFGGAVFSGLMTIPLLVRFSGGEMFLTVIMLFLTAFACGIAAFLMAFIYGPALPGGKFFIAGLGLYVVALALGGEHAASYAGVLNTCAIVLLVITLFAFNIKGLAEATSPGQKRVRFPKGMRRNNMIILAVFVVLAFALANIKAIKDAAVAGAMWVVNGFMALLLRIADLNGAPSDGGGASYGDGGMDLSGLITEVKYESPLQAMLWQIFLYVLIGAILVLLCFFLYKLIRKLLGRFGGLLDKFSKISPHDDSYIDETEDLESDNEAKDGSLIDRLRRRFTRPPKIGDMPSPRAKVRFAMREFLKSSGPFSRNLTPSELVPELEKLAPGLGENFSRVYAKARYTDEFITSEEAGAAHQLVDKL